MQAPTENYICDVGSLLKYLYYYVPSARNVRHNNQSVLWVCL